MEYPFFFKNKNNQRLFGILHSPEKALAGGVAIVCCNPLFEEKLHAHRILVNFARYAVGQGFHVLRFDYYGDGESEGLFEEATITSRIQDIKSAVGLVEKRINPSLIILLGLRLGGTLAIITANNSPQIGGIVAWAPILKVKEYLYEVLRINLSNQLAVHKKILHSRKALIAQINSGKSVNIEGYELSNPFFDQAVRINLLTGGNNLKKPICVFQISEKHGTDKELQKFVDDLENENVEFKKLEESRFWLTQKIIYPACSELFSLTTKWIVSILQPKEILLQRVNSSTTKVVKSNFKERNDE
jgi:uncharacterized protein